MAHLVDYHVGRLSREMNAAVEAHIKICPICQRRGLRQAANEKRTIQRRIRRVRPTRRLLSKRGRGFLLFLTVLLVTQLIVIEFLRGAIPLPGFLRGVPRVSITQTTATPTPTPSTLTSTSTFASSSTDTAAMALSPDGKTLATVPRQGSPAIVLWNVSTGKQTDSIPWPDNALPGILSWSRDGKHIAAADGSVISAWELPSHDPKWSLNLPSSTAMRVYDVQAGTVTQRPDPATAFANGTFLQWGANGQVVSAPAGAAGSTGIVAPGAPLVGLWQVSGSHIFLSTKGVVAVGVAPADATRHSALLSWSPDGRYILWGIATQPIAIAASNTASATATSGTQVVTPTANSSTIAGVPPPDAIVASLASNLGQTGHGDVLVWFSPDGKTLAECDSSSSSDALQVFDISSARAMSIVPSGCKSISSLSAFAWEPSGTAFLLALPRKPIAVYRISPAAA
ncbi:MAG: hypothetical protein ACXVCO_02100 [Ktedonobacterales bacterium]